MLTKEEKLILLFSAFSRDQDLESLKELFEKEYNLQPLIEVAIKNSSLQCFILLINQKQLYTERIIEHSAFLACSLQRNDILNYIVLNKKFSSDPIVIDLLVDISVSKNNTEGLKILLQNKRLYPSEKDNLLTKKILNFFNVKQNDFLVPLILKKKKYSISFSKFETFRKAAYNENLNILKVLLDYENIPCNILADILIFSYKSEKSSVSKFLFKNKNIRDIIEQREKEIFLNLNKTYLIQKNVNSF